MGEAPAMKTVCRQYGDEVRVSLFTLVLAVASEVIGPGACAGCQRRHLTFVISSSLSGL
jgi:hypothetical protein